jgi:trk system potassium uptake protein TrkA
VEKEYLEELLKELGIENEQPRLVFVIGYSKFVEYWFDELNESGVKVKFFHPNGEICERISSLYGNIEVYQTLPTDGETLLAEGIDRADYVWCLDEADEENMVHAVFAKSLKAKRVGILLKHPQYENLVPSLGIDSYVLPKKNVAAKIYGYLKGDKILKVIELEEDINLYEVPYEGEEKAVRDLKLSECDFLVAVERDKSLIIPRGDTVVKKGDLIWCVKKI